MPAASAASVQGKAASRRGPELERQRTNGVCGHQLVPLADTDLWRIMTGRHAVPRAHASLKLNSKQGMCLALLVPALIFGGAIPANATPTDQSMLPPVVVSAPKLAAADAHRRPDSGRGDHQP